MTDKQETKVDNTNKVENALGKTEQFIDDNQKIVSALVIGFIAIIVLYLAYQKFYLKPLEEEAQSQMFVAQQYFDVDSFALALNGDINYPGFIEISEDYSATKAGNLSNYYAGISYLHIGRYEDAINYLEKFSADDKVLQYVAIGAMGDAYMELNKPEEAITNYKNAGKAENELITPFYLLKAGIALENLNRKDEALEIYKSIKKNYKESKQGIVIDKYITKLELSLNK